VSVATPWHLWPWLRDAPRLDLMYHSIHYFDSIRAWLGDPQWVTSHHARFPDQPERAETKTLTVLEYESGLHALVAVNHHDHSGAGIAEFRILGTAGAIEGTIGLLAEYPRARPDTLRFTSQRFVPHMWHAPTLTGLWLPDAFVGPMYGLMQAIDGGSPPETDALDHCQTLRVVHAAYRSAAERRSVALTELP
jgi:predicted dehydrogenase